jgi:malonyl-CoA O-methyltransferase
MKEKIKKYFSKSALTYDKNASLQRYLGDKLIAKLVSANKAPQNILDIGAGTACDSVKLSNICPNAKIVVCDIAHGMMKYAKRRSIEITDQLGIVTADMEHLPFAEDQFDVVYSNAAMQWVDDIRKVFVNTKKILKNGGTFCFSTFGPYTLDELDCSFDETYKYFKKERMDHINKFIPFEEIILELRKAGFAEITAEVEKKTITYKNVKELFKSLKSIGSHKDDLNKGLMGKEFLHKVFEIYESKFKKDDGIYATYVVYYFTCTE